MINRISLFFNGIHQKNVLTQSLNKVTVMHLCKTRQKIFPEIYQERKPDCKKQCCFVCAVKLQAIFSQIIETIEIGFGTVVKVTFAQLVQE